MQYCVAVSIVYHRITLPYSYLVHIIAMFNEQPHHGRIFMFYGCCHGSYPTMRSGVFLDLILQEKLDYWVSKINKWCVTQYSQGVTSRWPICELLICNAIFALRDFMTVRDFETYSPPCGNPYNDLLYSSFAILLLGICKRLSAKPMVVLELSPLLNLEQTWCITRISALKSIKILLITIVDPFDHGKMQTACIKNSIAYVSINWIVNYCTDSVFCMEDYLTVMIVVTYHDLLNGTCLHNSKDPLWTSVWQHSIISLVFWTFTWTVYWTGCCCCSQHDLWFDDECKEWPYLYNPCKINTSNHWSYLL